LETKYIEGPLPDGYRCDFDSYLFNEPKNLTIQSSLGWKSFYALRTEKKAARARVHFHIENDIAVSPLKNPFGSFEFSDTLPPKEFFDFIRWVEAQLISTGVKKIEIKCCPELYNRNSSALLSTFLFNLGYSVKKAELSACIEVSPTALYTVMTSWEKRKAGQIKKSNLRFNVVPVTKLKEVFEFISSCREERKQTLSMSYGQIKTVCDHFPERFCLFGMFDNQALAAASISMAINKSVLYNFYSAHSKQYDSLSPVVRLMEGIYEYCQVEKYRLIDLGTSALQGRPNFSLLDFKLNLGAIPTQKIVFEKVISA
jgi:hypothetical protein